MFSIYFTFLTSGTGKLLQLGYNCSTYALGERYATLPSSSSIASSSSHSRSFDDRPLFEVNHAFKYRHERGRRGVYSALM